MLLPDLALTDTRVINEAASLEAAGYRVRVVMPAASGSARIERPFGFEVQCVPPARPPFGQDLSLLGGGPWEEKLRRLDAAPPGAASPRWQALFWRVLNAAGYRAGLAGCWERRWLLWEAPFIRAALEYRPDIVHAHDLQMLRAGRHVASRLGVPLVYDAHELLPQSGDMTPHARRYWEAREKADIGAADLVLTVNAFLAKEFVQRYGVEGVRVIHNASPREDHSAHRESSRRALLGQLPAPQGRFCLLIIIGGLSGGRGLMEVLESLALLPAHYLLAVLGDGPLRRQMEQRAAQPDLAGRVSFHGMVSRDKVLPLAAGADVGIVAQQRTGVNETNCCPNRLSDYVVSGLPVALSDLPFLHWFVEEHRCGALFNPADPKDIAAKLAGMFEEPARFEELRANARLAGERFNWDNEATKLLEMYSALGTPAPLPAGGYAGGSEASRCAA